MVAFFGFLVRRGYSARNIALDLPRPHLRTSVPRGLSNEEIHRLLDAIPDTPSGQRDRAIVLTALFTGLRRSELAGLALDDVHLGDRPTLRVRVKGGAQRLRELPEPVMVAIATARAAVDLSGAGDSSLSGSLFGLSGGGFAANLRRYGRMAGVGHLTPHVLRHTAAKLRRDAGASLEEVSAFLGHASIATTAVYLRRLEGWRDDGWRDVSRLLALPHSQLLLDVEARAGPTHEWPSERGNAHSAEWQGGPVHGTPLPTLHSSSDENRYLRTAGATVTAPWRDERIGLLKSAVQKYIRRGETEKAARTASELLQRSGGRSALARRLPVIAAEDVGIIFVPAAATDHGAWADEQLLGVTAGLSRVVKSKDAYWLAATVWSDPRPISQPTAVRFLRELEAGDYESALRSAIAARDAKVWRSGDRVIGVLLDRLGQGPVHARDIGTAALRREAKGGFGMDELVAAAIIAAIDQPADAPRPFPVHRAVPAQRPELDFYVADGHTGVGQRALHRVAIRYGLPVKTLTDLMFSCESIVLGPAEIPSRWKDRAVWQETVASGFSSPEDAQRLWNALRPEVAREVERELARVTW